MNKLVTYDNFDNFIKKIKPVSKEEVATSCVYRNRNYKKGDYDNFCKATTHTNCLNCKFYTPDIIEKRRLVLEYVNNLHGLLVESLLENITMKEEVEFYRTCGTGAESDG